MMRHNLIMDVLLGSSIMLSLFTSMAAAQTQAQWVPICPDFYPDGNQLNPQWSPDLGPVCDEVGDMVVFEQEVAVNETPTYHLAICRFLRGLDTEAFLLTHDDTANRRNPQWSHDGKWIVYQKQVGSYWQLFRMNVENVSDGSYPDEAQITTDSTNHRNPRFSYKSSLIVYEKDVPMGLSVYSKIFKGCAFHITSPTQISFGQYNDRNPQWNRDGTYVLFERANILIPPDGPYFASALFFAHAIAPLGEQRLTDWNNPNDTIEDKNAHWFDDPAECADPQEEPLPSVIVFERTVPSLSGKQLYEIAWDRSCEGGDNVIPPGIPSVGTRITTSDNKDHESPRIDPEIGNKVAYVKHTQEGPEGFRYLRMEQRHEDVIEDPFVAKIRWSPYFSNIVFEYRTSEEDAWRVYAGKTY